MFYQKTILTVLVLGLTAACGDMPSSGPWNGARLGTTQDGEPVYTMKTGIMAGVSPDIAMPADHPIPAKFCPNGFREISREGPFEESFGNYIQRGTSTYRVGTTKQSVVVNFTCLTG